MKSIFIHSFGRVGSFMLKCLIDSHPDMACFHYLFRLGKIHERARPNLYQNNLYEQSDDEKNFQNLRKFLLDEYTIFLLEICGNNGFVDEKIKIGPETLVSGIPIKKIVEGINFIVFAKTMDELLNIEQSLGNFFGLKIFSFGSRLEYMKAPDHLKKNNSYWEETVTFWLEKENSHWIELIRNPYDRITSQIIKAPHAKITEIFEETRSSFRFVSKFKHERFLLIKYEDLCGDPDKELKRVSEFLGEKITNIELLNLYGQPFYPNTAKNVLVGKSSMHQDEKRSSRIGGMKSGRWNKNISPTFIAAVNQNIDTQGLYEVLPTSILARVKAKIWIGRLTLREIFRGFLLSIFKELGFEISRAPKKMS